MSFLLSPSVSYTKAQSGNEKEKVDFPFSALFSFHKNDAASHNFSSFRSFLFQQLLPPSLCYIKVKPDLAPLSKYQMF